MIYLQNPVIPPPLIEQNPVIPATIHIVVVYMCKWPSGWTGFWSWIVVLCYPVKLIYQKTLGILNKKYI